MSNNISDAASIMGKKGGKSGTGESKSRDPELMKKAAEKRWQNERNSLAARFWGSIEVKGPTECWPSKGPYSDFGYGRFAMTHDFTVYSHRMAWQVINGDIPETLDVLHKCDNPPCCNPNHLFTGTDKDNVHDCMQKGRRNPPVGSRNGFAKLNPDCIREIRRLKSSGKTTKEIAAMFKVGRSNIDLILRGKTWSHVH
jgi:hypothetical protein